MIQLVIEIPEEVRNRLGFGITYKNDLQILAEALNEGTTLPKGHGRLIDADVYKWDNRDIIDCEIDHPKYQVTLEELIDEASTIIEADNIEHDCCLWQDGKCVCGKSNCPDDYRCDCFD